MGCSGPSVIHKVIHFSSTFQTNPSVPLNQLQAGNGPMRVWVCLCCAHCCLFVHRAETGEWSQAQSPQRQPQIKPSQAFFGRPDCSDFHTDTHMSDYKDVKHQASNLKCQQRFFLTA